jgi:ankyrin repeat protein
LKFGANANLVDSVGRSLVWHASALGDREILESLLSYNGNPTVADSKGVTPLVISIINRHPRISELLLEILKVDTCGKDTDGTTALMVAAGLGDDGIVSRLLGKGCDPKTSNVDGHTALFFAHHGRSQLVYFLNKKKLTGEARKKVTTEIQRYSHLIDELMRRGLEASQKVSQAPVCFVLMTLPPPGSEGSSCDGFRYQPRVPSLASARYLMGGE